MSSFASGYLGTFLARCLALAGAFAVAIITARILGPEDRGRYYYVTTLVSVGAQLASLGIHASNSYLVSKQPKLLPKLLANTAWIALVGGGLSALGVLIFDLLVGEALQREVLAAVVLTWCPLSLLFLLLSNLFVAIERTHVFNGLLIFGSFASLSAALLAALLSPSVGVFLLGAVGATATNALLAWILATRGLRVPWDFDRALFSEGIAFALRAHTASLIGFLMARTSVLLLRHSEAFSHVGQWSIAAQIAEALLLLPATVGLLLFPMLVRASDQDRWTLFTSMLLRVSAGMTGVCIVAGLSARFVIQLLFGPLYDPAVSIVFALLPGVLFLSVAAIVSQFLAALGLPWMQVAAWMAAWVAQIIASVWLLPFGAVGLAWVRSASAGLACIWLLALAGTHRGRPLRSETAPVT